MLHRSDDIPLRTGEEIESISRAASVVAGVLREAAAIIEPGATTLQVNNAAAAALDTRGAQGLFRGYSRGSAPPFPGDVCISVNDEVVHGVPSSRRLEPGDLVSIDVGARFEGWCADAAVSVVVGESAAHALRSQVDASRREGRRRLITCTRELLDEAIAMARPGVRWSSIAVALERRALEMGYCVVVEYCGHGIGRELHESPKAPTVWTGFAGVDFTLAAGMVLAIEPILTNERPRAFLRPNDHGPRNRCPVLLDPDGWTVRTVSGADACHLEHTVAITPEGSRVLTA